jgi:hypothetical protein
MSTFSPPFVPPPPLPPPIPRLPVRPVIRPVSPAQPVRLPVWQRAWYALLDGVQWPWHRFRSSRFGPATFKAIAVSLRVVWLAVWIVLLVMWKVMKWTTIVSFLFMSLVLFGVFRTLTKVK